MKSWIVSEFIKNRGGSYFGRTRPFKTKSEAETFVCKELLSEIEQDMANMNIDPQNDLPDSITNYFHKNGNIKRTTKENRHALELISEQIKLETDHSDLHCFNVEEVEIPQ
jgi:hypothetical protein